MYYMLVNIQLTNLPLPWAPSRVDMCALQIFIIIIIIIIIIIMMFLKEEKYPPRKERSSMYCVQTSTFLFVGYWESVNPPNLNIQEVQASSSRPFLWLIQISFSPMKYLNLLVHQLRLSMLTPLRMSTCMGR